MAVGYNVDDGEAEWLIGDYAGMDGNDDYAVDVLVVGWDLHVYVNDAAAS